MQNTDYFDLKVYEGTDIFNPLMVENENIETIDSVMHDNSLAGIWLANELKTGTVHAITRDNADAAVFRFVATSNWNAGDTMTVDGVQVSALLPTGETLADGSYVINSNVLCILTGSVVTILTSKGNGIASDSARLGGELPEYYGTASDVESASQAAQAAGILANAATETANTAIERASAIPVLKTFNKNVTIVDTAGNGVLFNATGRILVSVFSNNGSVVTPFKYVDGNYYGKFTSATGAIVPGGTIVPVTAYYYGDDV